MTHSSQLDRQHLWAGTEIPKPEGCHYACQPYVVVNGDGSWTCVMTTGAGGEGVAGQHVVALRSADRGATWSEPVAIEPPDGPEASWAQPLRVPAMERIYVLYTYNAENRRVLKDWQGGERIKRVDTVGTYAYRYSDDGGLTWSKRYAIPQRLFEIDRHNAYGGEILFFWGVGHPFLHRGEAMVPAAKVGGFRLGAGFFTHNEGMLLASPNLATEPDPERHEWHTRPEGDVGVRTPPGGGPIAGEFNACPMNDGGLFATFRTIDGYAGEAYSRDDGRSWAVDWMRYRPGGRAVKNPRAANFAWRLSNGRYLYWFHNHGGAPLARVAHEDPRLAFAHRNPAWLLGGVERDGAIHWSEPEIVLYYDQIGVGWSYPDLVEQDGRYYLTEATKTVARTHEIDPHLIEGMWRQGEDRTVVRDGLLLEPSGTGKAAMPELPKLYGGEGLLDAEARHFAAPDPARVARARGGLTVGCWLRFDDLAPWQLVLDTRGEEGHGMTLMLTDHGVLRLTIVGPTYVEPRSNWTAGTCETGWETDAGLLRAGTSHHVVFVVDGGPKIVTALVDGTLCDGGDRRQYGWGRLHPHLKDANGAPHARLGPGLRGAVERLRIYGRALRTSEAVANYHAGRDAAGAETGGSA